MDKTSGLFSNEFNMSEAEFNCYLKFYSTPYPGDEHHRHCNATWDSLSCWPTTPAGHLSTISCFKEFRNVSYDMNYNATRLCYENGTWADKSDYSHCKPLNPEQQLVDNLWMVEEASTIYYIGYGISLVALIFALWIFLYFKEGNMANFLWYLVRMALEHTHFLMQDLRCLRNTIHTNLMLTYLLIDLTWGVVFVLQRIRTPTTDSIACILLIFLTYLMGTNYFWMFVEGLYLYILVVRTFSAELVKFHFYAVIGWGLPAIFIIIWAVIKSYYTQKGDPVLGKRLCIWQASDYYDYIFKAPYMLVLVINIFFLGEIMWVLITKLRASQTVESKQYRKASKALLVLIPLLGVTYILVLVTPSHKTASVVFTYLQATLLSTQGFTVAVLYCFLNGEVRNSLRHHLERWKMQRTLDEGNLQPLAGKSSQHGEKIRACGARGARGSFATTATYVSNNSTRYSTGNAQVTHLLNCSNDDMV